RRRGTGTAEEIDGLRCGYTVSRHVQVRRADIRREAAAGRVAVGEELTDSFDELRVFGEIGKVGALCRIGGRLGAVGCALGELAKDAVAAYAAAEEQTRPLLLEDAVGWVFTRRLREEGAREVIPSDHGNDRVDPAVLTGEHQGQRTAVRTAHDAEARVVAGAVLRDLGPRRQPVDEPLRVADLVVRAIEVDLAATLAESPRGPGQHRVAAVGEVAGVACHAVLGAA